MKPIHKRPFFQSFIIVLAVFLFSGCAPAPRDAFQVNIHDTSCITRGWPHDNSDLQPDPGVVFSTLDNGLRYVIMENSEPENRVGLYLDIQAGSLGETDDQRGLAHFLEHMLFNGTTHYPPGTLVEYFQSIGMSFGADTNAHTSFNETVYKILLPDGGRKHLDEGLQVMADYARGALLLENEVDRERGIILAEKRARDSAGYRLYEKRTRFSFAGTRVAERLPIGTEETLAGADSALLHRYYDTWYRPENMILVIVGDLDSGMARESVVKNFSHLESPSLEPACYDFGRIEQKGTRVLYAYEPELGYTEVSLGARWNEKPSDDSVAGQIRELKNYVAASLLENRLQRLVNQPQSPLTKAQAYAGIFLQRVGYVTMSARTEAEKWQEGLELLNLTLRQALESGFSAGELVRVKREIRADLEKEIKTAAGRNSRDLASQIIRKLNSNQVFLSPEQELELYGPTLDALELEKVNQVFRSLWAPDNRLVMVAGTATADIETSANPEDVVRRVVLDSDRKKLAEWRNGTEKKFPYLPVPVQAAKITENILLPDIDTRQVHFANNTVLNIKKTDFQPNEVLVSVHFGQGRLGQPEPGLGMLAESVVQESGVGRLTRNELEEALAGSSVSVSFRVGRESFSLNGRGLSSELELLMQLVQTRLLEPAFREDAYRLSMDRFSQMYDQMENSVEGMLKLKGERFLAGGNSRYGLPPRAQFEELGIAQVEQWLLPVLKNAQLEVNVVGDIDPKEVTELVGRYFGTLDRSPLEKRALDRVQFPAGEMLKGSVQSQIDKALVVVAWQTDDFWDIFRTRRLNVLSSVFDDRLRVEIREKLGAAYSPVVYNQSSRVAPGYGVLRALLTVDPRQVQLVTEKVREVSASLAASGITEEELQRALEPTLTLIKDMVRTNRYWLKSVLALSSRHPEQLQWPLSILDDFGSITTEEVGELAARYLRPEASAEIVFTPVATAGRDD
jgi:zinc protease